MNWIRDFFFNCAKQLSVIRLALARWNDRGTNDRCLYIEPIRRSEEMVGIDIVVKEQSNALAEMLAKQEVFEYLAVLKKQFSYYKLDIDPGQCMMKGYERNEKKLSLGRRLSVFFAIITIGLD